MTLRPWRGVKLRNHKSWNAGYRWFQMMGQFINPCIIGVKPTRTIGHSYNRIRGNCTWKTFLFLAIFSVLRPWPTIMMAWPVIRPQPKLEFCKLLKTLPLPYLMHLNVLFIPFKTSLISPSVTHGTFQLDPLRCRSKWVKSASYLSILVFFEENYIFLAFYVIICTSLVKISLFNA